MTNEKLTIIFNTHSKQHKVALDDIEKIIATTDLFHMYDEVEGEFEGMEFSTCMDCSKESCSCDADFERWREEFKGL